MLPDFNNLEQILKMLWMKDGVQITVCMYIYLLKRLEDFCFDLICLKKFIQLLCSYIDLLSVYLSVRLSVCKVNK